ncbi:MAG: type II toxin-antitoxin system HicA family toxin [Pseudonocardiales bacterium]
MSPALPAVTGRTVLKVLISVGFVHVSTKGSHAKLVHPDGRAAVVPWCRCTAARSQGTRRRTRCVTQCLLAGAPQPGGGEANGR